MKVGARNQLKARVTAIKRGQVMAQIKLLIPAESVMGSVITVESLEEMGLEGGREGIGMILSDENRTFTICQATEHAMLIPWGRFARHLKLSQRLRAATVPRCHKDAMPGGDLLLRVRAGFPGGLRIPALKPQLAELEARYEGKPVRPYSKLAQARKHKATWERQLGSALEQEIQARRALCQHQQRLETLTAERDALLNWLAQLEVDNATNPNPVQVRWLLDGGFGDAANVTYLIEELFGTDDPFTMLGFPPGIRGRVGTHNPERERRLSDGASSPAENVGRPSSTHTPALPGSSAAPHSARAVRWPGPRAPARRPTRSLRPPGSVSAESASRGAPPC